MEITGKTKVVGLLGWPVGHSLSPIMHNACFSYLNMDWVYLPYEVKPENLEKAIAGLSALGVVGVNVTIPHKIEVMKYITKISKEAEAIGACNTIIFKEREIIGENTDGEGFIKSLKNFGFEVKGKNVVLIGAGGAGSAIGVFLAKEGVKSIYIFDEKKERAKDLKCSIEKAYPNVEITLHFKFSLICQVTELLINATPLGMKKDDPFPIDPSCIHSGIVVYDIIYNPRKTRLSNIAEKKGAKIINGLEMLIHQGALSFEKWTGVKPPVEVMRKAIEDRSQIKK